MAAPTSYPSVSWASCRFPVYGKRRSSWEPLLPDTLPYGRPHRCWSWRCPGCGALKSNDARSLVRRGIEAALADGLPLILLTLTEATVPRSFGESSRSLTQLMKRIQARFGGGLRWLAVAEWQRRGAVHWHVIVAGLAYRRRVTVRDRVYPGHPRGGPGYAVRKEADLRPLIERYGFGPVFNVHAVGVAGSDHASSLARYVAKYLTKTDDMASLPKGAQPVRTSRGRTQWLPGVTLTGIRDEHRAAYLARQAEGVA